MASCKVTNLNYGEFAIIDLRVLLIPLNPDGFGWRVYYGKDYCAR